jgi:hypothetical protein
MRPSRHDAPSIYVEDRSAEIKFAEANAQMATLRDLGDAIRQERRLLERTLDRFANLNMTASIDRTFTATEIRIA